MTTFPACLHGGQRDLAGMFADAAEHPEETNASDTVEVVRKSALEQLRECNDPAVNAEGHQVYLDMARVGLDNDYVGAEVILRWYERNMKMFVNLARLLDASSKRVLVVVGAGHVPLLTHFLTGAGRYRVESALDYLADSEMRKGWH